MKIFNRRRKHAAESSEKDGPAPPVPVRVFPGTVPLPRVAQQLGGGESHQEPADVDEHQGDATTTREAPALANVVERLAKLPGRAGRRAALKLLERQGSLELAGAQRADRAAEAQARADERRERITRLAPNIVYALAVAAGAGGQVTGIGEESGLHWPALLNLLDPKAFVVAVLALLGGLGVAGLIEGSGLAFATAATKARLAGRSGAAARLATWVCALAASGINAWLHWDTVWAYPTALGSLVALCLWEFETAYQCAEALAETRERLQREAAVQQLAYEALKLQRGRRVARLAVATMTREELGDLVAETVRPADITRSAVAAYVRDRERNPQPSWWSRLQQREQSKREDRSRKSKTGRAPRDARKLTDGSLPEGPVSPAPSGAARASAQQIDAQSARDAQSTDTARAPQQRAHINAAHGDNAHNAHDDRAHKSVKVPDEARAWITEEMHARSACNDKELTGEDVGARWEKHPATGRRWLAAVKESLSG